MNGLVWDKQGRDLISIGADGAADVWDFGQSSPLAVAQGRLHPRVVALQVLNGKVVAGRTSVGSADVWQLETDGWKLKIDLFNNTLAVLGKDRFKAMQPEIRGKATFVPVPTPEVERIEIDPQGMGVAWTTRDGAVLWRSLNEDYPATVVYDIKSPGSGSVVDLSLGLSGHYLAIAYADHHVLLFGFEKTSTNGFILIKAIDVSETVRSISLNRTETLLAAGLEDGSIGLWSVPDGACITTPKKIHSYPAGNLTFAADGLHLFSNAVVGDGAEAALTVTPVPSLAPSTRLVARVSGDPPVFIKVDKELLVAADNDGKISYWDAEKLEPLGSISASTLPLTAATLDTGNHKLIVADEDGSLQALQLGGQQWQAFACALANRRLTPEEWAEFLRDERYAPACAAP